jgi:hypothetical protein
MYYYHIRLKILIKRKIVSARFLFSKYHGYLSGVPASSTKVLVGSNVFCRHPSKSNWKFVFSGYDLFNEVIRKTESVEAQPTQELVLPWLPISHQSSRKSLDSAKSFE